MEIVKHCIEKLVFLILFICPSSLPPSILSFPPSLIWMQALYEIHVLQIFFFQSVDCTFVILIVSLGISFKF